MLKQLVFWVNNLIYNIYNLQARTLCIFDKHFNLFNSLSKSLSKQGISILVYQHYFLFLIFFVYFFLLVVLASMLVFSV